MTYLPFVDGLRAVAIAAVVAYHAFPASLPGGYAGVDVFFVISGFLITRLIAAEIYAGTFSLNNFFVRRARRLLPAALACFLVVTVFASIYLLPDAYLDYGRSLISSVFMYANIYFYKTSGYFSAPALEKPLLHVWSLAVEDQFYLTWPLLLMLLLPRTRLLAMLAVTLILMAASLALCQALLPRSSDFVFFMLPTRAWELLTGAFLALVADRVRLPRAAAEPLSLAGMAAIGGSFVALNSATTFPGLAAAPACLGAAAVIASGLAQPTIVSRFLSLGPVVFLGLISYSLYLWHWPIIALLSYRLERPLMQSEAAAVMAASLAIAAFSWRFIEKPFRTKHSFQISKDWTRSDKVFAARAVALVCALGVAGALASIFKGVPHRFDPTIQPLLEQMVSGNPWRRSCDNFDKIFANDAFCNFGRVRAPGESYDVAVFGDSMADHWVPLVAGYAKEEKLAGRQVTNGGCALLFGTSIPASPASKAIECANYQREARKFLDANPGLKLAVISSFWNKWMRDLGPSDARKPEIIVAGASFGEQQDFDAAMSQTLNTFVQRGVKVLLIGQIPTYERLPVRCIVRAAASGEDFAQCGMTRADAVRELSASDLALMQFAERNIGVSVFLPSGPMCKSERCPPVIDGLMLYKNKDHISRFGSEYLRRFVRFPELAFGGNAKP